MDISAQEAEQSLEAIDQVRSQVQRMVAQSAGYLILWGMVWMVGFLGSAFLAAEVANWLWLASIAVGAVGSWILGYRTGVRVRSRVGLRIPLFWLTLFLYGALWIWLAQPIDANRYSLLIVTISMFGYVAMGLWLGGRVAYVGLLVTLLAIAGYLLVPAYFNLWMALLGGGTLIGSGLYARRHWG